MKKKITELMSALLLAVGVINPGALMQVYAENKAPEGFIEGFEHNSCEETEEEEGCFVWMEGKIAKPDLYHRGEEDVMMTKFTDDKENEWILYLDESETKKVAQNYLDVVGHDLVVVSEMPEGKESVIPVLKLLKLYDYKTEKELYSAYGEEYEEEHAVITRTVEPIKVEKLNLDTVEKTMTVGQTAELKCTYEPENAEEHEIAWSSSNETAVTVTKDGKLNACAEGDAVITASCNGQEAKCQIHVEPVKVEKLSVSAQTYKIKAGQTTQLVIKYTPDNAADKTTKWSSDNTKVATVDKDGLVKGISEGKAAITAECNGVKETVNITVTAPDLEKLELYGQNWAGNVWNVNKGSTMNTSVKFTPSNAEHGSVTYSSSDAKVATVNSSGVVTGVSAGSAVITASCNGKTDSIDVKVVDKTVTAVSAAAGVGAAATAQAAQGRDYIANTNTSVFHYPTCSAVNKMKEKNKWYVTTTRDDLINQGYKPCGICHP